jgi:uncharacterized protein (TIGR02246 family)
MTMSAGSPGECDRLFAECVNVGDLEALMALYEEMGSLVQRDGTVAVGHHAIRSILSRLLAMQPKITVDVVKVVRAGEDLAMLYSDWSMSANGPDGHRIETTGKAIEVVRRQADGTWRFVLDDPFARS